MVYTLAKYFKSKATTLKLLSSIYANARRPLSLSASLRKKQHRLNDNGFDNYMEKEKKINEAFKFLDIVLSQPNSMVSVSRLDVLAARLGCKLYKADSFIVKFPHFFEIFEHPVYKTQYCRLSDQAREQIEEENEALLAQIPDAVTRLRKLLMLSKKGRLRLDHVRLSCKELGLPDEFELSVILKNPQFFRLYEDEETRGKYIEIVEREQDLARCAIEDAREKRIIEKDADVEKVRFSFLLNFPPGFKVYDNIPEWQRLPYWSPYQDVSENDLRLPEAQKKMEKRAVALVHELLSLTVEKKLILERITHFRTDMDLPKKLKEFLLQHPGIFYITSKGSHGKLHTVFLKGAYKEGKLIEPNDLYLARRKLADFILYPRKAKVDKTLGTQKKDGEDPEMEGAKRHCTRNELYDFASEISCKQDEELQVYSDFKLDDNVGSKDS